MTYTGNPRQARALRCKSRSLHHRKMAPSSLATPETTRFWAECVVGPACLSLGPMRPSEIIRLTLPRGSQGVSLTVGQDPWVSWRTAGWGQV